MIVVDTNVIVHLYLQTDRSAEAEAVARRDTDWAAPRLWRSELRNVLAMQIKHRRLSLNDAIAVMSGAGNLLAGREFDVASEQILALATASGASAYDCEFVALALELGVQLVTADRGLVGAFPRTAVALADFAAG